MDYEDITGFRIWPWLAPLAEVLPGVAPEATCAGIPVSSVKDGEELLKRFRSSLVDRNTAAAYLRAEGPVHRYDELHTLDVTYPHMTWYEELLEIPVRVELRFVAVDRPVLHQAVIVPKTVYEGYTLEASQEKRQQATKDFLETLCARYETIRQILTDKYGHTRRSSYGTEEQRFWECVWERPSGLVQLHLGGTHCPYDFWISYCPRQHIMVGDEKAREAFHKL